MKRIQRFRFSAAVLVVCMAGAVAVQAQIFTTLINFNGTDGAGPGDFGSLVQGFNGDYYGVTYGGGSGAYCSAGCGTVFSYNVANNLVTPLHSFSGGDGFYPEAGLFQATDGNLYGTTSYGGSYGYGTVFKITPERSLTTLYNFCSQPNCTDGKLVYSGVIEGADGDFYGMTLDGGAYGYGTIYKVSRAGTLTTLYSFGAQINCSDGATPSGGLIQASDGNFYGVTESGGITLSSGACTTGLGTVFRITPDGTLTTVYDFCSRKNCTDGFTPYSGLIQTRDGSFYGTTIGGGFWGAGIVYRLDPNGTLAAIYDFSCDASGCSDGANPFATLVQGSDGNFYGATSSGGANGTGTIFGTTPTGVLTTLHSFDSTDGYHYSGLLQATSGIFYGTTRDGGTEGVGTLFSITLGLRVFVETVPSVGAIGSKIVILGNGLTGTTTVTFNGTAATFTVVSPTEIKATVPTGATSGKVQVTTPHGTLTSNVVFRVK